MLVKIYNNLQMAPQNADQVHLLIGYVLKVYFPKKNNQKIIQVFYF